MSTFMATNKRVILNSVNSDIALEVDAAITLAFFIYERNQGTELASIDYQLEKTSGRTSSVVQAWTSVSLVGVEDDVYEFDVTASGVTAADKLLLRFKIIDVDGMEYFKEVNDITIIA